MKHVMCRCATYGRPKVLNEAVESFLRQDYPNKSLWILNDDPRCDYVFDNENVKIINRKERYSSLYAKLNDLIAMQFKANPDAISVPWDDDDIVLPSGLSTIMKYYPGGMWFTRGRYYMLRDNPPQYVNAAWFDPVCDKASWGKTEGYSFVQGGDQEFFHRMGGKAFQIPRNETYYIYRWGIGHCHLSGLGEGGWENAKVKTEKRVAPRTYTIQPAWVRDYVEVVRNRSGVALYG